MKLTRLIEDWNSVPGPGDYRPGDEQNPDSPDYTPPRTRRRSQEQTPPNSPYTAAADKQSAIDKKHDAAITDVKLTQRYDNGPQFAATSVRTGIARDQQTADGEIRRIRYAANTVKRAETSPMDDGRVSFTIEYIV